MNSLRKLYINALPLMTIYPTVVGITIGIESNKRKKDEGNSLDMYSTLIGYTSLGIITGITYPISYPLCGCYILYKNHT